MRAADTLRRLAVGPEVRLLWEPHAGASGATECTVVCWALDAETYESYERVSGGGDGGDGDRALGYRCLAAAVCRRIEGVDMADELARYGSLAEWWMEDAFAARAATDLMPAYLDESVPSREDLDAIERAARLVLKAENPNRDPYARDHREGCEHDIWEDRDEEILLELEKVDHGRPPEGQCDGCLADRRLYLAAIKELGTIRWIDAARRAFQRSRLIEQNPAMFQRTSARDWLAVEVVRAELSKRVAWLNWDAYQRSQNPSSGGTS